MLQRQRRLNLGACAGFALANCDWLGRTIAFYQVFFQQGRVALGKWCPQKGHPRTPGMDFFVQCPGLIFLAARWSGPVRWHLVSPTLYIIIVYGVNLNKLSQNFVGALKTATFSSGSSNLEQILPFWATFEQNIGLVAPRFKAHIKHEKVNDFIENFNVFNFFFTFF